MENIASSSRLDASSSRLESNPGDQSWIHPRKRSNLHLKYLVESEQEPVLKIFKPEPEENIAEESSSQEHQTVTLIPLETSDADQEIKYKVEVIQETIVKPYLCAMCEYKTRYKSDLTKHMKSVHGGIKKMCKECGKHVSNMSEHVRFIHTQTRNYKCSHCEYACVKPGDLRKHIGSVHTFKVHQQQNEQRN